MSETNNKFCKFCGQEILQDAVICTHCGRQVEEIKNQSSAQPSIVINNANSNVNQNTNVVGVMAGKPKSKMVSILLCLFFGYFGAHKFYEGKIGMGVLYFFTCGLFLVGVIIDLIALIAKPSTYYV